MFFFQKKICPQGEQFSRLYVFLCKNLFSRWCRKNLFLPHMLKNCPKEENSCLVLKTKEAIFFLFEKVSSVDGAETNCSRHTCCQLPKR